MLAFVNGMSVLTQGTGLPGNVLILADGSTDEAFSTLNTSDLAELENLPQVVRDPSTGRPMASRETYMVVNQPVLHPAPGRPKRRFLQLRGIDSPVMSARVHGLTLLEGGMWFSEAGVEEITQEIDGVPRRVTAIQAVLGEGIARELGVDRTPEQIATARNPERLDVGDTFTLGERTWVVLGIMRSSGSTFGSEVWAKQSLVAPIFGKDTFTSLLLRTPDATTAEEFKEYLNKVYQKARVAAQVETAYYAGMSEMNLQFLVAIAIVTVVMSIGGIFGVMNTMFAAISQRTKDIGVLRLLGFSRPQILVSFLLESLVIALIGGLLGCALGTLADGVTATSVVTSHSGGGRLVILELIVSPRIVAVGILLTVGMGVLGGVIPSLTAMRLTALDALRS
jgi:ABC-type lipoprotein release transport system permease subunit